MEVTARLDKNSTGKRKRYIIGDLDSSISGAIYLKSDVTVPIDITVKVLQERSKSDDK